MITDTVASLDNTRERFLARIVVRPDGCWRLAPRLTTPRDGFTLLGVTWAPPFAAFLLFKGSPGHLATLRPDRAMFQRCGDPRCCNPQHLDVTRIPSTRTETAA